MSDELYKEKKEKHEILFSPPGNKLGQAHWYIQKGYTELRNKIDDDEKLIQDKIQWWVFEKEKEHENLLKMTRNTLEDLQTLKEDSAELKNNFEWKESNSYSDLIERLAKFSNEHSKEIESLLGFVKYLFDKNKLAPSILFSYRVWGSTRKSKLRVKTDAENIEEDEKNVKKCTETVFGLRIYTNYQLNQVHSERGAEIADSLGPEELAKRQNIKPREEYVVNNTVYRALDMFALYMELIRKALRHIEKEIEKYNEPENLVEKDSFWKQFICEAMDDEKTETELWDFKETLEMWHTSIGTEEDKNEKLKFCRNAIASFANNKGGVIIIGITDGPPRKIKGIDSSKLEEYRKSIKDVIGKYVEYEGDFTQVKQVIMDLEEEEKSCLIIVISQTKEVVAVNDGRGNYSYPYREETGTCRASHDEIKKYKEDIPRDNIQFITNLRDIKT